MSAFFYALAGHSYLLGGIGQTGGALTEAVLGQTISKLDNVFVACAAQLGKNFVSEGVEEWLQYGLEGWFKNIAQGTNYRVDMLSDEALYNGLLGAISATVMEGPAIVFGEVGTHMAGKKLQAQGVTGAQLQRIGSAMPEDIRKLTANLTEKSSPYAIGKAFQEIGAFLSEQDQQQVVLRMVDQGVMLENAQTLVGIVEHLAAGGSLTQQQINLLNANESLGQALMQTIHDAADTQAASTQSGNTQAEADPGQATSTQNAIIQQNPAAESAQPQQTASTNQDLLLQAEAVLGELSQQERSVLSTYQNQLAYLQSLEQQRQVLLQQKEALNSGLSNGTIDRNALRQNAAQLSNIEAQISLTEANLRRAMETQTLSNLLQKLQAADFFAKRDAKNQTLVLDSLENHGILGATGFAVYKALSAELNGYGVSDSLIQKLASLYVPQRGTSLQEATKALATAFRHGSVNAVDGQFTTDTTVLPDAVWNAAFKLGKDFGYGYSANNAAAKDRKAAANNASDVSDISLSEKRAKTVRENYAYGQQFESECVETFGQNVIIKAQQVTIQTDAGEIRADFVTIDENGVLHIYEFKSSQTAQLTKNQKAVFAEIYSAGGTMVGENASVFGENVQIPEGTIVEIVRGRR